MNNAVLYFRFREYGVYGRIESFEVVGTGNEDVLYAPVLQAVQYRGPVFGAFVFSYPHTEYVFMSVQVYGYRYVDGFLYYLAFASDVVVYGVEVDDCIDRFKRTLLPFSRQRQYLVGYAAYCGVRYRYAVYVSDMV